MRRWQLALLLMGLLTSPMRLLAADIITVKQLSPDLAHEMNHVEGILVLQGGLPIEAVGYQLGAIGVSGAPGGDRDEVCAHKALEHVQERLEFAE
jgi:uncharacterized protein GlcG (DUF336 family)